MQYPSSLGRTPITIYTRDPESENAVKTNSYLSVPHHSGGLPKYMRRRPATESGLIFAAYGYADGAFACYIAFTKENGAGSRTCEVAKEVFVFRSDTASSDCITCVDVSEHGTVYVGTSSGAVVVMGGNESGRAAVTSCRKVSIR